MCERHVALGPIPTVLLVVLGLAAGQLRPTAQTRAQDFGQIQPPRDTPAQPADPESTATISGRVVDLGTGLPLKRARVTARSSEVRERVGAQTDEAGRFVLADLPEGRYTLSVSKPGFITLSYGQRRPRQPATPVQVNAGQHLRNVNFNLPPGSVITGHVVDEDGAALPLATVRVLRYVYRRGQQQLVPAGTDRTDDRGQYRIFGLEPGDYYVSAVVPRQLQSRGGGRFAGPGGQLRPGGFGGAAVAGPRGQFPGAPVIEEAVDEPDPLGYAATYYPGVTSVGEAARLTVGLSAELGAVDFAVRLVPTATVSGMVFNADGTPASAAQVMLTPDTGSVLADVRLGARVQGDGGFDVRNVPPGRYVLRALTRGRRRGGGTPTFASQALSVDGYDLSDLTLVLAPGATVSGSISFETTSQTPPDSVTRIRVTANSLDPIPFAGSVDARVESDATFQLQNVADGPRLVRAAGVPDGWILKAVYLTGQDVIDTPIDFGSTGHVEGLELVFTDQVSQLTGVVHDGQGVPLPDFTVIAFPANETLWQPQSRHIQASRPDQNARYQIRGLPPGEYLLTAVDVVQQGEWFDPRFLARLRSSALRLSIDEGEARDLNLTLSPQ